MMGLEGLSMKASAQMKPLVALKQDASSPFARARVQRAHSVGMADAAHDSYMENSLGERAMRPLQSGKVLDTWYGDLVAAARGGAAGSRMERVERVSVSQPGDPQEREADQAAERVMRMPMPGPGLASLSRSPEGVLSRKCDACKIEGGHSSTAANGVTTALPAGGGHPLDTGTRAFMEPRFGTDFSDVRVYTGGDAAASARSLNAQAYTVGRKIVFGSGQHQPASSAGRHLLAHELAHVVQHEQDHDVSRIHRQVAAQPPDPGNCRTLLDQIKEAVAVLVQRAADLIADPQGLQWDNVINPKIVRTPDGRVINFGSVQGHQQQYENWRTRLRNKIREWDDDDCNQTGLRVPAEAREWQFRPVPAPTQRPRPDTTPQPWEAPGARRVGKAATGALIGAGIGAVLGGITGAVLGGGGGTLVLPGVGTIGGGAAGFVAGAEAGAWAGAAIGGGIGAVVGWLTGD